MCFSWLSYSEQTHDLCLNAQIGKFANKPSTPVLLNLLEQHHLPVGTRLGLSKGDWEVTVQAGIPCKDCYDLNFFVNTLTNNFRQTVEIEIEKLNRLGMIPFWNNV